MALKCPEIPKFQNSYSIGREIWYFEEKIDFVEKRRFEGQFFKHAEN